MGSNRASGSALCTVNTYCAIFYHFYLYILILISPMDCLTKIELTVVGPSIGPVKHFQRKIVIIFLPIN